MFGTPPRYEPLMRENSILIHINYPFSYWRSHQKGQSLVKHHALVNSTSRVEGTGISVCQENMQTPLRLCGMHGDFTLALSLISTGLSPD